MQAAIAAVDAGDTIQVCAGTYNENLSINKNVTIVGAGRSNDPAASTILQGDGTTSVVNITAGTVSLQGLRITGGVGDNTILGGGINVPNDHSNASVSLSQVAIVENTGTYGGGIYLGTNGELTIKDSIINQNTSNSAGSAIAAYQGRVTMNDCTLRENETENDGPGTIFSDGSVLDLSNTTITQNMTAGDGGGIGMGGGGSVTLNGCVVSGNRTTLSAGGGNLGGGGIFVPDGELTLIDTDVFDNMSATDGGGIYNDGTVTLESGRDVTNNIATGTGGGIFNVGSVTCTGGSSVTSNTPDQCVDGSGGSGCNTC